MCDRTYNSCIDHYGVLGIPFGATEQQIKKQYHKMALKYHPDKSNCDPSMFREVQESYEALTDVEFRTIYDRIWFMVRFEPEEIQRQKERQCKEEEPQRQKERQRKEEELERQKKERQRKEEELQRQKKERQRQQCEREAQVQREREKEQCHEREKLKRKREADDNIQRELLKSKTELEALKRELEALKQTNIEHCQSIDETRREKEVLMQRNVEMEREMRDAERECGRACITVELLKICANGVRHNTDAAGIEWYAVIDFMKRVCPGKDKQAVNRNWEFFRDRSKHKDEIAKFTRKIDFRYESTYSPSEAGLGRQNGTPAAQLSGLERMLAILSKKHVGTDFHSLVDKVNE